MVMKAGREGGAVTTASVLRALAQYSREVRTDGKTEAGAVAEAKGRDILRKQELEHEAKAQEKFQTALRFVSLGLSVSYGIVQRHGGTLAVDSVWGEWTEFTFDLPRPST